MTEVAVVIPFFQRRSGVLRRALASVLAQKLPDGVQVQVVLVDDQSPAPVDEEVRDLVFQPPFTLTIVRRANGGVAAARNSGLEAVKPGTDYVAFLDSDDYWEDGHLREAVGALDAGYDYFFCNNRRLGAHDSYFQQAGFDDFLAEHGRPLGGELYAVDPARLRSLSLRAWISLIPTVVFRRAVAPDLRFKEELRAAGEDCLFLLQVMARARQVCCSRAVNVTCADGINLFYSTYDWNHPGHMDRRVGQLMKLYCFRQELDLPEADRRYVEAGIVQERRHVAFFSLRGLVRSGPGSLAKLRTLRKSDASFWTWFPYHLASMLVLVPLKRFAPTD